MQLSLNLVAENVETIGDVKKLQSIDTLKAVVVSDTTDNEGMLICEQPTSGDIQGPDINNNKEGTHDKITFLNDAHAVHRPAYIWLLHITFIYKVNRHPPYMHVYRLLANIYRVLESNPAMQSCCSTIYDGRWLHHLLHDVLMLQ